MVVVAVIEGEDNATGLVVFVRLSMAVLSRFKEIGDTDIASLWHLDRVILQVALFLFYSPSICFQLNQRSVALFNVCPPCYVL